MQFDRPPWRSLALRPLVLLLLLLSEIVLLITIVDLWALSAIHAGFINIGFRSSTTSAISLHSPLDRVQPLLWTALPTLVLTLYRLFREAAIAALVVEMPFIELRKTSAAKKTKVRKSVYVDYRTSFSIVAWYKALKNGHTLLALCMLASFVVSLALVPLAGGLFAEGHEILAKPTSVRVISAFRVIDRNLDSGALLDAASASWIDNAPFPAGTDGHFPLPQIEPTENLENFTISTNVATTQLSLDCVVVVNASLQRNNDTEKIIQTTFSASDRDCAISGDILSTAGSVAPVTFLKAFSQTDCPTWAGHTRAMILYVNASGEGLWNNYTLLSCIPSYWGVNGTISVTEAKLANEQIRRTPSFKESSRRIQDLPALTRQNFEQSVMNVLSLNVGSTSNSGSRFAELISRYIESRGLAITPSSLTEASATVYAAIYTMLCVDYFFPRLDKPELQAGSLSITENRLHVIVPVAIAMVVILTHLIIETVYLIVYLRKYPTILAEEPIGLVGAANLLHNSNIACLLASCHEKPSFDGRLRRPVLRSTMNGQRSQRCYTDDELLNRDCWIEQDEFSTRPRIVIETRSSEKKHTDLRDGHTVEHQNRSASHVEDEEDKSKDPVQITEYTSPPDRLVRSTSGGVFSGTNSGIICYAHQHYSTNDSQSRDCSISNYELGPSIPP